ncbi:MAG: amidohydrolase family protein [Clostridia bacterium]|nr:amidohydrolase family protein [Clostridia bacterium]
MIWDADAHISSENGGIRIREKTLLEQMDANGVEKSLIWLHPGQTEDEYVDYDAQNKYIYDMGRKYPDRFHPVGWLNPKNFSSEKEIFDYARKLHEVYGFGTVKLNGAQNFFHLIEYRPAEAAIEAIVENRMKLAFHCGNDVNTHPNNVSRIAKRYPVTPILLVHMGQTENEAAIQAARDNSNIYLIGSGMTDYAYVRKAVDTIGSKRVLFGSDIPFGNLSEIIQTYENVLVGLNDTEKQNVFYANAEKFFL